MPEYEAVIGLEVHAELQTQTKIFCGCPAHFGGEPNTHVCPVCAGLPGVLPVLNAKVVDFAIMAGLALNCTINRECKFDRKNYFYPDLPKGYQVSQFDQPICLEGWLEVPLGDAEVTAHRAPISERAHRPRAAAYWNVREARESGRGEQLPAAGRVRIRRIHMEEDAGKLVHVGAAGLEGADYSLVDLNRAGVPLLEIVSEPDIRSSEEAKAYLQELRLVLMVLGINDGRLEEGSLRCDANVSIRPRGSETLGTRAEIKNLNSFRFLQKAIDYEIARQIKVVEGGGQIVQETRLWAEDRGVTYSMRTKEEAHDYRYFPEPDLVPLAIGAAWIEEVRGKMPELPSSRRHRYVAMGLTPYNAAILATDSDVADFFDRAAKDHRNPKAVANWLIGEVAALLKEEKRSLADLPFQPAHLAKLVDMVERGAVTSQGAKKVLAPMVLDGRDPEAMVAELGLGAIGDEEMLRELVQKVVAANPSQVAQLKAGQTKVMGFLMGQVMRETKGRAVPEVVQRLLSEAVEQA